jgi:exopolyphosphatase/guanosine-5'-triphosphate,3'-diphosphate pyrophosphatase
MKYAAIDIGTNTLRLLVAEESDDSHGMKPLGYKRIITRLGGGYTEGGALDEASRERTILALEELASNIDEHQVEKVRAVATSVVRNATDGEEFVKEIKARTGIDVDIIGGGEEARLTVFGVLFILDDKWNNQKDRLIIDIGGGSTEFIITKGADITAAWSLELGVVHLAEGFLNKDRPTEAELEALNKKLDESMADLTSSMKEAGIDSSTISMESNVGLVGTAGTITTLAAFDQSLKVYSPKLINNYSLKREKVESIFERLKDISTDDRLKLEMIEEGREDLIIPGTAIVLKVMETFGFDALTASDGGLLEGVMLRQIFESRTGAPPV